MPPRTIYYRNPPLPLPPHARARHHFAVSSSSSRQAQTDHERSISVSAVCTMEWDEVCLKLWLLLYICGSTSLGVLGAFCYSRKLLLLCVVCCVAQKQQQQQFFSCSECLVDSSFSMSRLRCFLCCFTLSLKLHTNTHKTRHTHTHNVQSLR